jgi:isoleucyl-tRNA synthetase
LASNLELVETIDDEKARLVEIDKGVETYIMVEKVES